MQHSKKTAASDIEKLETGGVTDNEDFIEERMRNREGFFAALNRVKRFFVGEPVTAVAAGRAAELERLRKETAVLTAKECELKNIARNLKTYLDKTATECNADVIMTKDGSIVVADRGHFYLRRYGNAFIEECMNKTTARPPIDDVGCQVGEAGVGAVYTIDRMQEVLREMAACETAEARLNYGKAHPILVGVLIFVVTLAIFDEAINEFNSALSNYADIDHRLELQVDYICKELNVSEEQRRDIVAGLNTLAMWIMSHRDEFIEFAGNRLMGQLVNLYNVRANVHMRAEEVQKRRRQLSNIQMELPIIEGRLKVNRERIIEILSADEAEVPANQHAPGSRFTPG